MNTALLSLNRVRERSSRAVNPAPVAGRPRSGGTGHTQVAPLPSAVAAALPSLLGKKKITSQE